MLKYEPHSAATGAFIRRSLSTILEEIFSIAKDSYEKFSESNRYSTGIFLQEAWLDSKPQTAKQVEVSGAGDHTLVEIGTEVFKLPWREAGPPNHRNDKVDSDMDTWKKVRLSSANMYDTCVCVWR